MKFCKFSVTGVALLTLLLANFSTVGAEPPAETALDRYVKKPDASYSWKVVKTNSANGLKTVVVDMVSQTWRTAEEVDRPQWQHWVTFAFPEKIRSSTGFLYISGGRNGNDPPDGPSDMIVQLARATGTVVAELRMAPNQPLIFHNDGKGRFEDDLIGYTWDQFLKTGDENWPARNAMIKSAVRAMDTMTALMASDEGGNQTVDKFVVSGASKRGWTTWLTGAIDDRVVAIIPIVIDVLNTHESMMHHFKAYGFWAPSVGNYVQHRIMERMTHPRMQELYELVDPFYYRHRLEKPKFILNASGDQFFLPDSSRFYWDQLLGPKYLRYVPNADHSLRRSDGLESVIAFYSLIVSGKKPPRIDWKTRADGAFEVSVKDAPKEVLLWQAHNPDARDFRIETLGPKYTSTPVEADENGLYVANIEKPSKGWSAYFVELTFDVGAAVPLKLTTNVRVIPDVLPYADKDPTQPGTVTVICTTDSDQSAQTLLDDVGVFAAESKFSVNGVAVKRNGKTCYINWRPIDSDFEPSGKLVTEWLAKRGANNFRYQLESGENITGD